MLKYGSTKLGAALLAPVVAVTAALAIGPASAGAAPTTTGSPASLAQIKAMAASAVSKRVDSLNSAVSRVEASKALGSDAGALVAYLQSDVTPLQNLGATIAADTTVTQAWSDYKDIFSDYRVYALVLPAARQAARADAVTVTAVPRLTSIAEKAQSYVTSANQATLQPMVDSLNGDISGATSAASNVTSTVLGYTPSQWNADHTLLSSTRTNLMTATGDVKSARSEVRQIRQYLRSNRPALGRRGQVVPSGSSTSS